MFQIGGKLKSSHESLFFCVLVCPLIFCTIICGCKDFRLVDKLKKHMAIASIFPVKVTVIVIQAFPCHNEHLEILHPWQKKKTSHFIRQVLIYLEHCQELAWPDKGTNSCRIETFGFGNENDYEYDICLKVFFCVFLKKYTPLKASIVVLFFTKK